MTLAAQEVVIGEAEEHQYRGESLTRRGIRRLLRKRIAVVCLIVIAAFYVTGILAPWIAPHGWAEQNLDASFQGPSWEHPLGTDRTGRDMLSRNLYAARTTVIVTFATILTGSVLLPLTLGMLAGYRGGGADSLISRTGEILASLPGLPMLILISAALRPRVEDWIENVEEVIFAGWMDPGLRFLRLCGTGRDDVPVECDHPITDTVFDDYFLLVFVLSLFGWVGGMRLIRTQTMTLRDTDFVLAARANGASTFRILFSHILPNVLPLVIVGVSASLGAIAAAEIALTFLGVGVQQAGPSFGILIGEGASRTVMENHPQLLLIPAAIVASLMFAFNLLGDALIDVFTPRAR